MKKHTPDIIAALDIGGTKTCCMIARASTDGSLRIIGASQQLTRGMAQHGVIAAKDAEDMFRSVISAAEKTAGININEVTVTLSGCRQRSAVTAIQQEVRASVTGSAMLRMVEKGCRRFAEEGRGIMHAIPLEFALDNATGITDPAGMYADEAAAKVHLIDTDMCAVSNIAGCLARCHIDIADIVTGSYASCISALTDCEKQLGTLVIECGGANSSLSLFKDNRLHYADTLPVGATNITKDIAIGLCTSVTHAERLKNLYGSVMPSHHDEHEMVEFVHREDIAAGSSEPGFATRASLVGMIAARVEETVDMLLQRMPDNLPALAPGGVVLVGGGANLGGMIEYINQRMQMTVRIGRPPPLKGIPDAMSGPAFTAVTGALRYPSYKKTMLALHMKDFHTRKGPFRRIKEWIDDNV